MKKIITLTAAALMTVALAPAASAQDLPFQYGNDGCDIQNKDPHTYCVMSQAPTTFAELIEGRLSFEEFIMLNPNLNLSSESDLIAPLTFVAFSQD